MLDAYFLNRLQAAIVTSNLSAGHGGLGSDQIVVLSDSDSDSSSLTEEEEEEEEGEGEETAEALEEVPGPSSSEGLYWFCIIMTT